MLRARTPTQAQSSDDASLIVTAIVAGAGGGVLELSELPPPPQALRLKVTPVRSAQAAVRRNILRCISKILLSVGLLCRVLRLLVL
jgi:hypothetical protein